MTILEEQINSGEHNHDVTGKMETHPVPPTAKKVYSKPTLVVLSQNDGTRNKPNTVTNEATPSGQQLTPQTNFTFKKKSPSSPHNDLRRQLGEWW